MKVAAALGLLFVIATVVPGLMVLVMIVSGGVRPRDIGVGGALAMAWLTVVVMLLGIGVARGDRDEQRRVGRCPT